MSFAALRASARRVNVVASSARGSRVALRNSAFRKYSTEVPPSGPAPKGSNKLLIGGIAAAAVGGAAFWVYASNSSSAKEAGTALKSGAQAAKVAANYVPTKEDYQKVYNRIAEVLDSAADKEYDDGSYGPVVVRLAWHSSGTYDKETNTGGSFSAAVSRLFELGVPTQQFVASEPWIMKNTDEN